MTRPIDIRPATADDLATLARLAATAQATAAGHCVYLGTDCDTIASELAELDEWCRFTRIAIRDGHPVGWLAAETDPEVGRVWWWGPFVDADDWHDIADRLIENLRVELPVEVTGEEAAADDDGELIALWAQRHAMVGQEASVALVAALPLNSSAPSAVAVRPLRADDGAAVEALHDELFENSHRTGRQVIERADETTVLVAEDDGVVGYVAAELDADGSCYVEYLGVAPDRRGRGVGRALIDQVTAEFAATGVARAHLTVRESNAAARRLYASLGFRQERMVRPYRKGFRLP